jgi:hypothetical protein
MGDDNARGVCTVRRFEAADAGAALCPDEFASQLWEVAGSDIANGQQCRAYWIGIGAGVQREGGPRGSVYTEYEVLSSSLCPVKFSGRAGWRMTGTVERLKRGRREDVFFHAVVLRWNADCLGGRDCFGLQCKLVCSGSREYSVLRRVCLWAPHGFAKLGTSEQCASYQDCRLRLVRVFCMEYKTPDKREAFTPVVGGGQYERREASVDSVCGLRTRSVSVDSVCG